MRSWFVLRFSHLFATESSNQMFSQEIQITSIDLHITNVNEIYLINPVASDIFNFLDYPWTPMRLICWRIVNIIPAGKTTAWLNMRIYIFKFKLFVTVKFSFERKLCYMYTYINFLVRFRYVIVYGIVIRASVYQHIEAEINLSPFRIRYVQSHFLASFWF